MSASQGHRVWYASYGSNCDANRFSLYLEGGTGPGGVGPHRGARNQSPPLRSAGMEFPSQVAFARHSRRWGAGVAFLEHRRVDNAQRGALGRRYLITFEQFEDVFAQENQQPTVSLDLDLDLASPTPGELLIVGESWYSAIISLPPVEGIPVLTFTSPSPPEDEQANPPSAEYIRTIAAGIQQVHDLTIEQVVDRLRDSIAVSDAWSRGELLSELTGR